MSMFYHVDDFMVYLLTPPKRKGTFISISCIYLITGTVGDSVLVGRSFVVTDSISLTRPQIIVDRTSKPNTVFSITPVHVAFGFNSFIIIYRLEEI